MPLHKAFEDWFELSPPLDKWQPRSAYEAGERNGESNGVNKMIKIINVLIDSGSLKLS
jgi:hypothetical protein